MCRGWSFIIPAVVMVVVTIIIFLFLVTGKIWYICIHILYACTVCVFKVYVQPHLQAYSYVDVRTHIYTYMHAFKYSDVFSKITGHSRLFGSSKLVKLWSMLKLFLCQYFKVYQWFTKFTKGFLHQTVALHSIIISVHMDESNGHTVTLVHLLMLCSGEY